MASISYIQLYISGWLLQMNAFTLKSWLTFMRSALSCGILLLGDEFLTPAPRFSRACLTQSVILSAWLLSNQRTPLRLAFLLISQQRRAEPATATATARDFISLSDVMLQGLMGATWIFTIIPLRRRASNASWFLTLFLPDCMFGKTLSLFSTAGNTPFKFRQTSSDPPCGWLGRRYDAARWSSACAKLCAGIQSQKVWIR